MKKIILTLIAVMTASMYTASMASVEFSTNDIRTETRFLTDKMRYELNLDEQQYNDVYEINYDFLYSVRNVMDDVAYGDQYATNVYNNALNNRNDDLRYVLDENQYETFLNRTYFSRPFYVDNNRWGLDIYLNYEPNFYYYSCPSIFYSYFGGYVHTPGYFIHRYNHPIFNRVVRYGYSSIVPYVDRPEGAPRYNGDSYRSGYARNTVNNYNNTYNSSNRYNNRSYNSGNRNYNNNIRNNNNSRNYNNNINTNKNYNTDSRNFNNTINTNKNYNTDSRNFNNTINTNKNYNSDSRSFNNSGNNNNSRSYNNNNTPTSNYSNPSNNNNNSNNRSFNESRSMRNNNTPAPSSSSRSFSAPSSPKVSSSPAPSRSFSGPSSSRNFGK